MPHLRTPTRALVALTLAVGVGFATSSEAGSYRGLLSADGYTASFANGGLSESAVGLNVDLAAQGVGFDALSLVVDARLRHFLDGGDLTDPDSTAYRVDELWAGIRTAGAFEATLGRRPILEVEGASVDGLDAAFAFGAFRLGVFGGLEPNPYDRSFDGAYMTYGAYGRFEGEQLGLGAGWVTSLFEGATDRQSATLDARYGAAAGAVLANAAARFDVGGEAGTRLGAVRLFGDWRPDRAWSLGVRYDLYRYLLRDASLDPDLRRSFEDLLRQSLEGRARYRWSGGWSLGGRLVYRRRRALDAYEVRLLPVGGAPQDGTAGAIYVDSEGREYVLVADTRDEDALGGAVSLAGPGPAGLPLSWRVAYTLATGFGRDDHELAADLRIDLSEAFELDVGAGVARRSWSKVDAGDDLGGFAELSLLWMLTRDTFATATYDGRLADGELDHTLFLRVGYRLRTRAAGLEW